MWVVKCGGSLAGDGRLPACLRALVEYPGGVVLVPGGGVFADGVREQQRILGYGEAAAHHMALLAMDQLACYLRDVEPRLTAFDSIEAAGRAAAAGGAALLQASGELLRAPLPASWAATSDSLAGYAAGRVGADHLLLLKAFAIDRAEVPVHELARDGYVDQAFPAVVAQADCGVWWQGPEPARLAKTLYDPGPSATRIVIEKQNAPD